MGYYINPIGKTKEEWLLEKALRVYPTKLDMSELYSDIRSGGNIPLVLVNNGLFTALAIAFSEKEFLEFTDILDTRQKQIFIASKSDVLEVVQRARMFFNEGY